MTTNILNEKLEKSLTFSPPKANLLKNNSNKKASQDGSYVASKVRQDDAMSEVSMSSRASTASDTLQRAKNRQDFWSKQNKRLEFED